MPHEVVNPRRTPRLNVRCAVEIRHGLFVLRGETEDLGPRGCQLVAERPLEPGREVKLSIRVAEIGRTVAGAARVVWVRSLPPSRLGLAFRARGGDGWFEALEGALPGALRAGSSGPARLSRATRLFLGRPPRLVVDFSPEEREILRRVGAGTTVDALDRSFSPGLDRAARGALFSLVARGLVVLDPSASAGEEAWSALLPRGEELPATAVAGRPARSPEVQRLYEEGLAHLGAGHLALAVERFQAALGLDPTDDAIAGTMRRLSRWT